MKTAKNITSSFSSLSKEEKLALLAALEEKKRRLLSNKAAYVPHASQLEAHKCLSKVRFVSSSNGWGKSCFAVNEAFAAANGFNPWLGVYTPVPAKIAVVMDSPSKFTDVFIEEAKKWFNIEPSWLQKKGKPYYTAIEFPNGSVITLQTHEQEPMVFESIEIDMAIFDEPPPEHVYIGLRRGGRKKGTDSKFLIVGTPLGQPWLKEKIWDPWDRGETEASELMCFRGSIYDNEKNLADGYIESFSKVLSEAEKRVRLHGEFFNSGGMALAHLFKRETHVIEKIYWEEYYPCVLAIDNHPSKAHVALLLGADKDNRLVALKEWREKKLPRDFVQQLIDETRGYRLLDIVCDSLGSADYTGGEGFRSFIQVANSQGLRVRPTSFSEKNDEDFISRIQDSLRLPDEPDNHGLYVPKLRVSADCPLLIKDIENVQWARTKVIGEFKPKLDITHKDALACLKYALACNLYFKKTKDKIYSVNAKSVYGLPFNPRIRSLSNGKQ